MCCESFEGVNAEAGASPKPHSTALRAELGRVPGAFPCSMEKPGLEEPVQNSWGHELSGMVCVGARKYSETPSNLG